MDRSRDLTHHVVQLEDGLEKRPGLDTHQHDAVPQPLGDAHAAPGADVPQQRPERREDIDGPLIAFQFGQCGET